MSRIIDGDAPEIVAAAVLPRERSNAGGAGFFPGAVAAEVRRRCLVLYFVIYIMPSEIRLVTSAATVGPNGIVVA